MKANELIRQLTERVSTYGDYDVYRVTDTYGEFAPVTDLSLWDVRREGSECMAFAQFATEPSADDLVHVID